MNQLRSLFSAEDVVKKGLLADIMYMSTANKDEAKSLSNPDDWKSSKGLRIYEVFQVANTYSIDTLSLFNFYCLLLSYLTDSYIIFTLKMQSVSKNTIFGLKMMVKSGLEIPP